MVLIVKINCLKYFCMNGGICYDLNIGFICNCIDDWVGDDCS